MYRNNGKKAKKPCHSMEKISRINITQLWKSESLSPMSGAMQKSLLLLNIVLEVLTQENKKEKERVTQNGKDELSLSADHIILPIDYFIVSTTKLLMNTLSKVKSTRSALKN